MQTETLIIAPGVRIVVRDAEWLVRKVDKSSTGGQAISVIGLSELVKNKEVIFLSMIEKNIRVLDPVDTKLVPDQSSSYRKTILYMESLLRQAPPTDDNPDDNSDDKLYVGHKAAMDLVPYQLDPAIQALEQPRQRILMADAVGLGKTISCGVLLSELIRRGRGKRILVLAVKSMLTQFQKEMWSRFTIPLVRLDSVGIQRVRTRIPANHNPFYYYDKAIISIDTLKQGTEYRNYLENAYWDIIVIDEAQNVAVRGQGTSQRARLAELLSGRSDTLVMLSATPHDGKARSFASLMNMLDPTAIADPDNYGRDDIKGLFIRRFKNEIQDQVETAFKEREIHKVYCNATAAEETAYSVLTGLSFKRLDQRKTAGRLFKTTLEKAMFSSPAACLETIRNRVNRLRQRPGLEAHSDIAELEELAKAVERISPADFSKYQRLLSVIRDPDDGFGWEPDTRRDRLVIFTERIKTLEFLRENLLKDLRLKKNQVEILHGGLPDIDQQKIVEDFGREEAPVRLLIASDVASEGINLHYLSHRLIHFDIPWSLMVFQQRNGRIDRYGQKNTPHIHYLVNRSGNTKIKGDMRILELLIQKDEEAVKNIGDPATLMGVHDTDEEEKITSDAIEAGLSESEFEERLARKNQASFDPMKLLMSGGSEPPRRNGPAKIRTQPSFFENDYQYFKEAVNHLKQTDDLQADFSDDVKQVTLTATRDLKNRLRNILPGEVWPADNTFVLSAEPGTIQDEIRYSRKNEKAWPRIHYLWPHNPLLEWANDKIVAEFGRQEAPVISLQDALPAGETVFLLSGLVPNRKVAAE